MPVDVGVRNKSDEREAGIRSETGALVDEQMLPHYWYGSSTGADGCTAISPAG